MKKLLLIFICLSLLCLQLSGCSQDEDMESTTESASSIAENTSSTDESSFESTESNGSDGEIAKSKTRSFPAMDNEYGKNNYLDTPVIISTIEEFHQFSKTFLIKIERYKYYFDVDTAKEYLDGFDENFFQSNSLLVCRTVFPYGGFYAQVRTYDVKDGKLTVNIKQSGINVLKYVTSLNTYVLFTEIEKSLAETVETIELIKEDQQTVTSNTIMFNKSEKIEYSWDVYGGNLDNFIPAYQPYSEEHPDYRSAKIGLVSQIQNMKDWRSFYSRYSYNDQWKNLEELDKTLDEEYFNDRIILAVPLITDMNGVKYSMRDVKVFNADILKENRDGIHLYITFNERLSDGTNKDNNAIMIIHLDRKDVPENPYIINYINLMLYRRVPNKD